MNTVEPMYEWSDIPWRKLERNVYKLQKRIYKASRRGDVKLLLYNFGLDLAIAPFMQEVYCPVNSSYIEAHRA